MKDRSNCILLLVSYFSFESSDKRFGGFDKQAKIDKLYFMFPLTMRYRTLAFLTATPAFASILYVTSTLDFTTKPMFLEIRITGRFWSGNLFATWIFVVVISSWQNSTLSVRSSDMSSSKRGIVFKTLVIFIVVNIPACLAGDRGSIRRQRGLFFHHVLWFLI